MGANPQHIKPAGNSIIPVKIKCESKHVYFLEKSNGDIYYLHNMATNAAKGKENFLFKVAGKPLNIPITILYPPDNN